MTTDGEPTLDTAQTALIDALKRQHIAIAYGEVVMPTYDALRIEDAGAARHERLVAFDLVMPDGTRKTFTATITEDENE